MSKKPTPRCSFVVTAEHASATLPAAYETLLGETIAGSDSHRIFDCGAKSIAEELARLLDCPLLLGEYTRLLVDLNRSIGNSSQFSPIVFDLCESEKMRLLSDFYLPFRKETMRFIDAALPAVETIIHLSIHSFTKTFEGSERTVDLGVLFDDDSPTELAFGKALLKLLKVVFPELNVQANAPYHGKEDGHTAALRKRYPADRYIGIELEFSQDLELDRDAESFAKIISKAVELLSR